MNQEPPAKRLPRPNLRVDPRKWSGAQNSNIATRVAIFATLTAIVGGISLVFVYPYLNIDRFRMYFFYNKKRIQ